MCHENVCWEMIPIWKRIKRQERQEARKEVESNLSKGWVNIQNKSSLLNVRKADALSAEGTFLSGFTAFQLLKQNYPVAIHSSQALVGLRTRGWMQTSTEALSQGAIDGSFCTGSNTNTAFSRKGDSQIHSKDSHNEVLCRPANGSGKTIMRSF